MAVDGIVMRFAARWLALVLAAVLATSVVRASDSKPPSAQVDAIYVTLEKAIRDTPIEAMNEDWIIERVYRVAPEPRNPRSTSS
jgi:hypothetical protein